MTKTHPRDQNWKEKIKLENNLLKSKEIVERVMVIREKKSTEASDSYCEKEYFTILTVLGIVKAHSLWELKSQQWFCHLNAVYKTGCEPNNHNFSASLLKCSNLMFCIYIPLPATGWSTSTGTVRVGDVLSISARREKLHLRKIIYNPEILPVIISAHTIEYKNGRKTKEEKGLFSS